MDLRSLLGKAKMKLKEWAQDQQPVPVKLDENKMTLAAQKLEEGMKKRVIGQDRAITQFVRAYESYEAGISAPDKPLMNVLFLGPTGSGKTRTVEAFCEHFWGSSDMLLKVDCAEYQHSHEVSKLIGSPPGYVGYNSGVARLSQKKLESHWEGKTGPRVSVVLFDEIEKAHPDFHKILLGILDKGFVTLGNGEKVDMRKCFIVMTSNLGAKEVVKHLKDKGIGFKIPKEAVTEAEGSSEDQNVYRTTMAEVEKFFDAEWINRIDRVVVFRSLKQEHLLKILDIELQRVQDRVLAAKKLILLDYTIRAKNFLLTEGVSKQYGARSLRRAIERFVVGRLSRIIATEQAKSGDQVLIDFEDNAEGLSFTLLAGVIEIPEAFRDNPPPPSVVPNAPYYSAGWSRGAPDSPTNMQKDGPYFNDGYCGRCRAPWSAKHTCPDLKPKASASLLPPLTPTLPSMPDWKSIDEKIDDIMRRTAEILDKKRPPQISAGGGFRRQTDGFDQDFWIRYDKNGSYFECLACGFTSSVMSEFRDHTCNPVPPPVGFTCKKCGRTFTLENSDELFGHPCKDKRPR